MAFDQFGNVVPDGTPGSTAMPPVAAPTPATPASGSYYTGDPGNPLTSDPNAAFGSRTLAPGTTNLMQLNPSALGQGGVPGAASGPSAPAGPLNYGTNMPGTSPLAGQFSNAPFYGAGSAYDPVTLANAYGTAQGINPNSGQTAGLAQQANNLPLIYELLNGSAVMNSNNSYADFANQYLGQGTGAGLSTSDFFNAAFSSDQSNPIWQQLHTQVTSSGQAMALAPADQVNAFVDLMNQGLANTVPPPVLKSMLSMYGQAGSEYIAAMNAGQYNGSFTDFLQQRGLGPGVFGG